ncbi:serine/threonine protein kinase [Sandaracinus amylolyticus]|uniref:serine/threonine protein kinase n=1 Tax=Sandaracinus amylolyticus TaxID=927083 RepID=UPI001F0147C5|nr:serine/threonine protein kinase [Sandaracinus amylolyticus]UJR80590.1 Serine/threonine protein kinase [Sandaracinus amylolyticus]
MRICELCGARYRGTPTTCPLDGGRLLELPDPLLGRTIVGRYLVVEKIGSGGMGVVYRARDASSGGDVALKFLLPDLSAEVTNRQRFLREAKAANRIDHENIIDVMDFGETDGHVFLVMEFLQGIALAEEVTRGPLGVARSIDIAMQCASALARAHELDVVHRDIKPENIYLVGDGTRRDFVKLLDFGLAHMKGELRLTASGAVFGTPEYMAPEQARGAPLTGLADLYALGCVLFEMLTGTPPFKGTTPDLILKHMREPAPLPSTRAPGVPPELDAVVAKLLDKQPQRRHRDAYHLLEDLRRIADRLPAPRAASPANDTLINREPTARAPSLSLPADSVASVLPGTWEQRVAVFRQLVARAYPGHTEPEWIVPSIDALQDRIAQVRALERELLGVTEQAKEREAATRATRLRMGRAIDELGRDESRTLGKLDELASTLSDARRRIGDVEPQLARTMRGLHTLGATVSRESASTLREVGAIAAQWIEIDAQVTTALREIAVCERERDDLRFQISQLKGRLGTSGAELEIELGAIRERAAQLGAEREATVDDLQERALVLLRHFAAFPELQEAVRSASFSPDTRERLAPARR